jgi:hypothetical protein
MAQSPDDVVFVRAGTYVESVTNWPWSGALGSPSRSKPILEIPLSRPEAILVPAQGTVRSLSPVGAVASQATFVSKASNSRAARPDTRFDFRNEDSTHDSFARGGFKIVNNTFVSNGNDGVRNRGSAAATIFLQSIGRSAILKSADVLNPVAIHCGNSQHRD